MQGGLDRDGQDLSLGADPLAHAGQARRALDFFTWAFEKGDAMAEELDFIPMPDSVVKQIKQTWAKDIQTK